MENLTYLREKSIPEVPKQLSDLSIIRFIKEEILSNKVIASYFPHTIGQPVLKIAEGKAVENRPLNVGVFFSGGPASGGHNVIAALFDTLKSLHPESQLIGFLEGPNGIVNGKYCLITSELLAPYRNQGGFNLLGTGRMKLETQEQLEKAWITVQKLQLNGLIVIGGDDSQTNAAFLAEYFLSRQSSVSVIGVPKTIDGDLQSSFTSISFGFDTACKVYSEMIGNIAKDELSTKKYYHFIKLMGRSASHIVLECALSTHPNMVLIGEEILAEQTSFMGLIQEIADLICKRSEQGKDFGLILIPEGVIEFVPDLALLIKELNNLASLQKNEILDVLSAPSATTFKALPEMIQNQLLMDRDAHGNIPLSFIETERLLMENVKAELLKRTKEGCYKGKFSVQCHFFGYEGRSALPSYFDSHYCYALGIVSALLVKEGVTGYMSFITGLEKEVIEWQGGGVPLTALLDLEKRQGVNKPVIKKTLVDIHSKLFGQFKNDRLKWAFNDAYQFPGPIQFFGPKELVEASPHILK